MDLVRCEAAISYSPTICLAYLLMTKQFGLKDAFDYIKQRRSRISPNFGFLGQLLQCECETLPSMPTPRPSCQGAAAGASFTAHLQTPSPAVQASCSTCPTSMLRQCPPPPQPQCSMGAHGHNHILQKLGRGNQPSPKSNCNCAF